MTARVLQNMIELQSPSPLKDRGILGQDFRQLSLLSKHILLSPQTSISKTCPNKSKSLDTVPEARRNHSPFVLKN